MSTRDIAEIALFAALTAALGAIPAVTVGILPAPVIAQNLGCMLCGTILGARRGALAMLLFLVMVAAGLPLLSGGRGGLAVFFGPTGGFLIAWPLAAALIGLGLRFFPGRGYAALFGLCVAGGIVSAYLIGIPWLAAVAGLPLAKAALGAAVYLPCDLIKAGIAALVATTVHRTAGVAA
jgi:biotin transport system substrate-specific component